MRREAMRGEGKRVLMEVVVAAAAGKFGPLSVKLEGSAGLYSGFLFRE